MRGEIIFITGTDTTAGKTVLTGLLLAHLRAKGTRALAMKPFCSGDRADVEFLQGLQNHSLTMETMNPYFFAEPLAPWVAARTSKRKVPLEDVVRKIRDVQAQAEVLLVEGCGGVMVPLGPGYTVADLISRLACPVVIVAQNRLGVINHALLTCHALGNLNPGRLKVVLMGTQRPDLSTSSNPGAIRAWVAPTEVVTLPLLPPEALRGAGLAKYAKKLKKPLAQVLAFDTFRVRSFQNSAATDLKVKKSC